MGAHGTARRPLDLAGSDVLLGQGVELAGKPAGAFAVVEFADFGKMAGDAGTTGPGHSWVRHRHLHSSKRPWTAASGMENSCCVRAREVVDDAGSLEEWCRWVPAGSCKKP